MRSTGTTPLDPRAGSRTAPAAVGILGLGLVAASGLTTGIAVRLTAVLTDGLAGASIDRLVETGVLGIGVVLAAWLALSLVVATACATGRVVGVTWRAGERLVARCAPDLVRRALVLAVGAGIGLSAATGATAAAPGDLDLGWTATGLVATASPVVAPPGAAPVNARDNAAAVSPVASPTSSTARAVHAAPASPAAPAAPAAPAGGPGTVVVQPGDTLWHLAQSALPPDAASADIAAAWPAWYAANAAVIGDDPDLLQPGQVLSSPTTTTADGAS